MIGIAATPGLGQQRRIPASVAPAIRPLLQLTLVVTIIVSLAIPSGLTMASAGEAEPCDRAIVGEQCVDPAMAGYPPSQRIGVPDTKPCSQIDMAASSSSLAAGVRQDAAYPRGVAEHVPVLLVHGIDRPPKRRQA